MTAGFLSGSFCLLQGDPREAAGAGSDGGGHVGDQKVEPWVGMEIPLVSLASARGLEQVRIWSPLGLYFCISL